MAGILEEGPIRRMLREKGITKRTPEMPATMGRLLAFMGEVAGYLARQNEVTCDVLAKELTRHFELSGDDYVALRDHCISRLKR